MIVPVLCVILSRVSELSHDLVLRIHQLLPRQSTTASSVCYKVSVTTHTVISVNSMDSWARPSLSDTSSV